MQIKIANHQIDLIKPNTISARQTGLLNHKSISNKYGLLYKKTRIFHTFGMHFPITVACMNKKHNYICNPIIVEPNCIFIVPYQAYYTMEMHKDIYNLFDLQNNINNITKLSQKKAKVLFFILKYLKLFFIVILILIISANIYADEEIKISLGRERILDLEKPPSTIQISDPNVIAIERVGVTNSIKITAKQSGESKVTVVYSAGEEINWNIHVVSKNFTAVKNVDSSSNDIGLSKQIFAKRINKINGLKATVSGEKIIIMGEIKSANIIHELARVISNNPALFFPIYNIATEFEGQFIAFLENNMRLFGERNLKILNRNGIFTLTGVPSSIHGRKKVWTYISGFVPNIVDAMSLNNGDSSIVQINLDFLELAKGNGTEIGFTEPLFKNIGGDLIFPPSAIAHGIAEPALQIGTIPNLFKALKNNSFVRELAKPVIITRSGEKASFLAGGEVPVLTSTATNLSTTSAVTYKPFGILFTVTPTVQIDGSIWLNLNLEVSKISEELSYQNIPGFSSRKINTNIVLNEGNTALLSGLVQNKDVKQVQKIPLLGDIPVIGELFKSRKFQENDTELLVVISAIRADLNDKNKFSNNFIDKKFNNSKTISSGGLLD